MSGRETLAVPRKVAVDVLGDTVKLHIICGDDYEAQVLYDDIVERLRAGESISLNLVRPALPTGGG